MKKIVLLIVVAASMLVSSCSNDDDRRDSSVVRVTVDGILNTYNNITVEQESREEDGRVISVLTVIALSSANGQDYVSFSLDESDLGSSPILHSFDYFIEGKHFEGFYDQPGQFSLVVNQNNHRILKGAFKGNIITTHEEATEEKYVDGIFDIYWSQK